VIEDGASAAETASSDQGAAFWRARAVDAEARADKAEADLRFIANALKACGAEPGPV
jgi:hypothetical protein